MNGLASLKAWKGLVSCLEKMSNVGMCVCVCVCVCVCSQGSEGPPGSPGLPGPPVSFLLDTDSVSHSDPASISLTLALPLSVSHSSPASASVSLTLALPLSVSHSV